ncbi:MAG: hypothetical protein NWR08_08270 [Opitutales bacterium]|nr:hypothetical protein [Opitutales bacterium]
MKSKFRIVNYGWLLFLVALSTAHGQLRVIEEEAIPFTRFLSKADFDQRYPGAILDDPSKLDTGWYVIYEHESLSYYFGPILLESTGQDYYEQLKTTVGEAVDQRPTIEGYRLELSFEPKASSSSSTATTNPPAEESSESGYSTPQPAPKPSIFEVIKRWFGF